ncbi:hypothetical protein [Paenibacillus sp. 1P07SE]
MSGSKYKQDKPRLPEQLPAQTADGLVQRLAEEQYGTAGRSVRSGWKRG